jgi:hypothetical protein
MIIYGQNRQFKTAVYDYKDDTNTAEGCAQGYNENWRAGRAIAGCWAERPVAGGKSGHRSLRRKRRERWATRLVTPGGWVGGTGFQPVQADPVTDSATENKPPVRLKLR